MLLGAVLSGASVNIPEHRNTRRTQHDNGIYFISPSPDALPRARQRTLPSSSSMQSTSRTGSAMATHASLVVITLFPVTCSLIKGLLQFFHSSFQCRRSFQ